jgi:NADH-quinone oxidoreductase subunit M
VATELLVEGAIRVSPLVAVLVVASMALAGIALLRAYFRLFTGPEHTSSMSIVARWPEKIAVLTLTLLVLGGGLFPQPGVASRYDTAKRLLSDRQTVRTADRHDPLPQRVSRAHGSPTK